MQQPTSKLPNVQIIQTRRFLAVVINIILFYQSTKFFTKVLIDSHRFFVAFLKNVPDESDKWPGNVAFLIIVTHQWSRKVNVFRRVCLSLHMTEELVPRLDLIVHCTGTAAR